uniref:Protein kinase domain-containing protein n=1 Tax=Caenorhabditis japonica TaxID=281687 RepID=A0A8R1HJ05_CAEJA
MQIPSIFVLLTVSALLFHFHAVAAEPCSCSSKCVTRSSMALKGRIRQENIDGAEAKLAIVAVVYVEGIEYEDGRYDVLKNESSLSIDWLPMSHDVIESSRRPPSLQNVHFVDVGQETTALVIELLFDLLNMKLRSTYEIRVTSLYDTKCDRMLELTTHAALNVTFACERIIGADCHDSIKIDHHPVCDLMRTYHTQVVERNNADQVDVLISIEKNDNRMRKMRYFIAFQGKCESELSASGECVLDMDDAETRIARFCVPNRSNCTKFNKKFTLTIENFEASPTTRYGVQICGVLDHRFENPPILAGSSKIAADTLTVSQMTASLSVAPAADSLIRTLIGYAFVLAFLLIILIIFISYKCATGRWCKGRDEKNDQFLMDENSLTLFENHVIGKGRFGTVCIGQLSPDWQGSVVLDDQQRVAVKTNRYLDKSRKRDFFDEIEGAKEVGRHSRILSFIGTVVKNGNVLHVMEYCGNGNLLDYLIDKRKYMVDLQEKGIDLNESLPSLNEIDFDEVISIHDLYRISSQICTAMMYLGSKSIVHNALCARHVMISSDHNVKLADFGSISTPSTPNCTPIENQYKWSSLELLRGETATQLSDVWSYGVVLWEIFTMGGRPYYNVPDGGIRGLVEKGFRLQKPEGASIQMYQLMRESWLDNPADRPTFSQISQRISNFARENTPEHAVKNFITISTLCDYYLDDTRDVTLPRRQQTHYDAAALISESERLLGYRL